MDEDGCELDDDFMSQSWLGCNTPEFSSIYILSPRIFQQLANSFKGGHVDGNSVVKRAFHGVVTGWVTSWEVSPVRRVVLHQPYLVRSLPPGPQRYQAGMPARDWGWWAVTVGRAGRGRDAGAGRYIWYQSHHQPEVR